MRYNIHNENRGKTPGLDPWKGREHSGENLRENKHFRGGFWRSDFARAGLSRRVCLGMGAGVCAREGFALSTPGPEKV